MKYLPLSQGKYSIVDDEDYDWLNQWKWYAKHNKTRWYAVRTTQRPCRINIRMHRLIMSAPQGRDVDHINGNGIDNRRKNLRLCTRSENLANKAKYGKCSSKHKGVWWHKTAKKWAAGIMKNKKAIHLGLFDSEIEAAIAYDNKAKKLYGEYAMLNIV